jgi:4'-phosphopantetheinyl transferase
MIPADGIQKTDASCYDLRPDLIRVWRVFLDGGSLGWNRLETILSADEVDRARRFHFDRDRRRFTLARGALRMILAGYLNIAPNLIAFTYGPQGKPFLSSNSLQIQFNVAHSEELALIAVSSERELGVDVERVRPLIPAEQIMENFFSLREAADLRSLPKDLAEAAFFACWTRKEAYVKARGGGISIPFDSFDVSVDPSRPPALLDVHGSPLEALRWGMVDLQPADGYAGSLVAQGRELHFAYCDGIFQGARCELIITNQ